MRLILIRHAEAGDRDPSRWPDDTERPLTDKGRRRHRRVAKRLKRRGLVPTLLLTSPWLRAWQTAEITATYAGGPAPLAAAALAANPSLEQLEQAVGLPEADAVIALVGHEPWLGELASLLLAGEPHRVTSDFPKSGVLGLECESLSPGSAVLQFLWRPRNE